jgi:hypothetical protein
MRLSHRWYTTSGLLYRPPARGRISHAQILNPFPYRHRGPRWLRGAGAASAYADGRTARHGLGALAALAGAGNDQGEPALGRPAQHRQDQSACDA